MPKTPEQIAREAIDRRLNDAGWIIQDMNRINLSASPGVAVREFPESIQMREAKKLKRISGLWKSGKQTDADQIFTEIADHATVITGESVTFHLKCGLNLTETLIHIERR